LVTKANLTVIPMFAGTGMEGVVNSITTGAFGQIKTWGEEMKAEFTRALETGTDIDWNLISELQQKIATYTAALTGGLTTGGKFQAALDDLKNANPETITNFIKAYDSVAEEESGAIADRAKQQREWLQNLQAGGMEKELNAALEDFGFGSYDSAIAALNKRESEAQTAFQGQMVKSIADTLTPQIGRMLNDPDITYAETAGMIDAMDNLLGSIDPKGLDKNGQDQYKALQTMLSNLETLMVWTENKDLIPRPDFGGSQQGGTVYPATSSQKIQIDTPKLEVKLPSIQQSVPGNEGGTSGNNNFNFAIGTSDVILTLDGRAIAAAVIKYMPKAQAQTGRSVYRPMGSVSEV